MSRKSKGRPTLPKRNRALPKRRLAAKNESSVESGSASYHSELQFRIEQALALQKQGRLEDAKQVYCDVIRLDPVNADAWHLLGVTLHMGGQDEEAVECLQSAVAILPDQPELFSSLGVVLRSLGQQVQAVEALQKAAKLNPNSAEIQLNLGTVLMESNRLEDAELCLQSALKIAPDDVNASTNLANLWQRQGRVCDAESLYRKMLEQHPSNVSIQANLAESLRNQGRFAEAVEQLEATLKLDPTLTNAAICLGRSLAAMGQSKEARRVYQSILEEHPQSAKAHHYLADMLLELDETELAALHLAQAQKLAPNDAYVLCSQGKLHLRNGDHKIAEDCYRAALNIAPQLSDAHSSLLYVLIGDPDRSEQELFDEHVAWGKRFEHEQPIGDYSQSRDPGRRLRIGYLSPDFRQHAVASYIGPVLKAHDRERVEVYCYAEASRPDATTSKLQTLADHWRMTNGLSNEQVACQIHSDQIDILVDLAGHTANSRLLAMAHRPAPIQMTWLGYPNTTGLKAVDYRLTCETQNPSHEPTHHVEQLLRLQGGSFCYELPAEIPQVRPLPCLRSGQLTFGALHRPFKITEPVQSLWARVLQACPDARLLLFNTAFTRESTYQITAALTRHGIAKDRVEIRNQTVGESYLQTYADIDIALDVFPWAGGTTTLEALAMGVPVVAMRGRTRASRSTATIVANCGLSDWIADSMDAYVNLAVAKSQDLSGLAELRKSLRSQLQSSIADHVGFTRKLESAYRLAWHQWCEQQ